MPESEYMIPRVMRQKNMVMSPAGPGTKNDCASKASSNLPDQPTKARQQSSCTTSGLEAEKYGTWNQD
jgi:hypothetical protein